MMPRSVGFVVFIAGVGIAVIGLVVWSGGLGWFGRLPGDIRVERETTRVYVPIASMVVVSAALSLILWIVRKLF